VEGVADRALDRIRLGLRIKIVRRPVVVDSEAPGAARPSSTRLQLEIIEKAIATRIGVSESGYVERDIVPFRGDAETVIDLNVVRGQRVVRSPNIRIPHAVGQIELGLHGGIVAAIR